MEEEAAEAAESGGEGGGSEGSATASKWWIIAVVAALVVLAAVAIAIPVLMKRSDGEVTNKLRSGAASMGHSADNGDSNEDFLDLDEFDEDDQSSTLKNGKSSGKLKVEIPKDCGTPMTVKLRRSLLLAHNRYRSRAARGKYTIKAKKSALKKLPTAARMLVLKYNCSLEQTAMKWANQAQCQMTHSDYDVGENLYAVSGTSTSLESAAESATEPWVEEINQFGISSALTQRPGIGHATQVLWGTTETLGCGVIKCKDGGIMVVCQYYPAGNYVGQAMYKSGKPLSECGSGKRKEVAHTKTGLCFSP